jgi:hypothetical protein
MSDYKKREIKTRRRFLASHPASDVFLASAASLRYAFFVTHLLRLPTAEYTSRPRISGAAADAR